MQWRELLVLYRWSEETRWRLPQQQDTKEINSILAESSSCLFSIHDPPLYFLRNQFLTEFFVSLWSYDYVLTNKIQMDMYETSGKLFIENLFLEGTNFNSFSFLLLNLQFRYESSSFSSHPGPWGNFEGKNYAEGWRGRMIGTNLLALNNLFPDLLCNVTFLPRWHCLCSYLNILLLFTLFT